MQIPHHAEATWNPKSGDLTYAKFTLDKVEYNNPSRSNEIMGVRIKMIDDTRKRRNIGYLQ